jgi:hypothetical protein
MPKAERATRPGLAESGDLVVVDLDLHPNEASGLLTVQSPVVLAALGWDFGLWTVLDEGRVEDCIALIGHRAGAAEGEGSSGGWDIRHVACAVAAGAPRTQDTEAVAYHDGWVYLVGSHFGTAAAGLASDRHYLARLREDDAAGLAAGQLVPVTIVRDKFRLHRAVNDALKGSALALWPVAPRVTQRFVERTRTRGAKAGKRWAPRLQVSDWPLNIEGAAFRPNGDLIVGLRFPCTADGHPVLVALRGLQRWFDDPKAPLEAAGVWVVDGIGSAEEPCAVRDLEMVGERLHLLVGNLDAELLEDGPKVGKSAGAHWWVDLPADTPGGALPATFVRGFAGVTRMEGLALDATGRSYYVSDEDDRVLTLFARAAAAVPGGPDSGSTPGV